MSEKITFKQLIEHISSQSEQSQNSTNSFLHELVQIIESGLQDSGSVSISEFGKFELRWMNERAGRNPQTGEKITIPGQNKVVFKPYKALRENVNRPYANMKSRILEEENSDVKEDSSKPPVVNTGTPKSSQEDNNLIVERSKPAQKSKPAPKPTQKKNITKSNPFETVRAQKDDVELIESVQDSGDFKWSYAAASFIVMIAILAIIFFMMRPDTTTQTASDTSSENTISQTDLTAQIGTLEPAESITETASASSGEESVEFMDYQVAPGESLWSIAEDVYGDPYLWPLIFSANNNDISNPNVLTSGINIEVPELSDSDNLSQPQLDQLAEGYLSVYEWTQSNNPEQAKYFLWAVGNFSPDILAQASNRVNSNDLAFAENR
ncbi:MAG: HU family DNA-binding protein [Balneolaceae bacterium]